MTIGTFLAAATQQLKTAGIVTARLDCLVLLEDELHIDRALLLAHPEYEIDASPLLILNNKIVQRAQSTPLAYLRGKVDFYGHEFVVDEHVLVPRPESEKLIDLLLALHFTEPFDQIHIADIGAGSGCLGITAALELPHSAIDLYDIDDSALTIALRNVKKYSLPHTAVQKSNLLTQAMKRSTFRYDAILANLPYVPKDYQINDAAKHEPAIALFAGEDGLDLYRTFWRQLENFTAKPTHIITESFPFQHEQNQAFAKIAGYSLQIADDFAQCFTLTI